MRDLSHIRHNRLFILFLFGFSLSLAGPLFFQRHAHAGVFKGETAVAAYRVSIRTVQLGDPGGATSESRRAASNASPPAKSSEVYVPIGISHSTEYFFSLLSYLGSQDSWFPTDDVLRFTAAEIEGNLFFQHEALKRNLKTFISNYRRAHLLIVDGEVITALETEQSIDQLLSELIRHFSPEAGEEEKIESLTVSIRNRIQKGTALVSRNCVLTTEKALELLLKGTTEERDYTVKRGDTAWDIARKFQMSVTDIEKANPDKSIERIYVGDVLNLIVPTPLVHVETDFVHTTTRLIPYTTIVKRDNTLYRTQSIVERRGSSGRKRVKTKVTLINGAPINTEILSETITQQPVVAVVRKGTLRTPDDWLTAAFLPKEIGIITSPFGMRWGRFHRGIDVGVPPGTPVYAIRSGRVLFASFDKRLGYFVLIQHSGGLESLYGHNSELLVRRGDAVRKGQMIARSGNTGYSTGPHVHFEVHKSGKLLDPILFLRSHYEDAFISEDR